MAIGIAKIEIFLGLTPAHFKDNDEAFKNDTRDALLFFDTAKTLGFPSFPSDIHEATLRKVPLYFVAKGNVIKDLVNNVKLKRTLSTGVDALMDKSVLKMSNCFFLLKSFEIWLTQDNGYYVTGVKKSIDETTEDSSMAICSLLEDLNTTVKKYGTEIDPSMLPMLHSDFQICDLFSSVSEYLPSATGALNFIIVKELFKTAISKIKSDTCDRILNEDFQGILDELKKYNRGDSFVSADVRSILEKVFPALTVQMRKITATSVTIKVSATTKGVISVYFDSLLHLYKYSILFRTHLEDNQLKEINEGIEIAKGINKILHDVCVECKSSLTNLRVTAAKGNFFEAEDILHLIEQVHSLLVGLAKEMQNIKMAHEQVICYTAQNILFEYDISVVISTS